MDFGPTSMEKETFGRADGTCFARDADAGPSGPSADRILVIVARGAVVLIEGRARRVDDSKNELGRMPIEDFRPADRKSRFRCSPRWRPADVSMWVYARAFFSDTSFTTATTWLSDAAGSKLTAMIGGIVASAVASRRLARSGDAWPPRAVCGAPWRRRRRRGDGEEA